MGTDDSKHLEGIEVVDPKQKQNAHDDGATRQ